MVKKFLVIEVATGNVVCEGTARQVNKVIGLADKSVRDAAKNGYTSCNGKYRIIDLSDDEEPTNGNGMKEAAENWDKFCEPIRKKYGIPVYKAKPEVSGWHLN